MIHLLLFVAALQCPDGSAPPCRARVAAPPAPPDSSLAVVLPFRVSTSDTLLGEGLADMLATELTGQGVPRAVDVGTTLRAWRSAGGGPRRPLTQSEALAVARALNAGLVISGSVVRLGDRVTLNSSIIAAPIGVVRRRIGPISGAADSLEFLVQRLTNGILAAFGGDASSIRLSENNEASRWYLTGLSAYHRGRFVDAASAFERALQIDSLFASAAYMRSTVASWYDPERGPFWARKAWLLRDRLAPLHHLRLAARYGDADQKRDAREQLARLGLFGRANHDSLFHSPDINRSPEQHLATVRDAFELSGDTSLGGLQHVMELAAHLADTATLVRAWPSFHSRSDLAWPWGWMLSAATRDARLLATLSQRSRGEQFDDGSAFHAGTAIQLAAVFGVPGSLIDSLAEHALRLIPPRGHWAVHQAHGVAATIQGRGGAARSALSRMPGFNPYSGYSGDALAIVLARYAELDSATAEGAHQRLMTQGGGDSAAVALRRCVLMLWRGGEDSAAVSDAPSTAASCRMALAFERTSRTGNDAELARLDSALTRHFGTQRFINHFAGFENLVRARAWAVRGDTARALKAVRTRPYGFFNVFVEAPAALLEARLAGSVGDTATAVGAYRRYLRMRSDPEPRLVPQRDSARQELADLMKAKVPR